MNATAPLDVIQVTDYQNGSDSDTNIDDDDDAPAAEFYQPVSAIDSEDDEDQIENDANEPELKQRNLALQWKHFLDRIDSSKTRFQEL
ncbi:hypothetical protein ACFX15_005063 [Malus domestica]